MILTTHALTGAAIGKNIGNPWLIIATSVTIHFIMDSFRHGEYFDSRIATIKNTWWKVATDLAAGSSIIAFAIFNGKPDFMTTQKIFLGVLVSMFPDLLTLIYWRFKTVKILAKIKAFHSWAHRYSKFPKYSPERQWNLRNARNDILISALAILIFLFL